MVEPHIQTTMTAVSDVDFDDDEEVVWEIETADGVYEYPVGKSVTVSFNSTGKHAVKWCTVSTSRRRLSEPSSFSLQKKNLKKKFSNLINSLLPVSRDVKPSKKVMHEFKGFVGPKAPQRYKTMDMSSSASSYVRCSFLKIY